MAPLIGLEPMTFRLTAESSLSGNQAVLTPYQLSYNGAVRNLLIESAYIRLLESWIAVHSSCSLSSWTVAFRDSRLFFRLSKKSCSFAVVTAPSGDGSMSPSCSNILSE